MRQAIFSNRDLYQICPHDLAVHIHIHLKPIGFPILQLPVQFDGPAVLDGRPPAPGCPAFTSVLRAVNLPVPPRRHPPVKFKHIRLFFTKRAPQAGFSLLYHRQGNLRLRAGERHPFKGRPRRRCNLVDTGLCNILPAALPIHKQGRVGFSSFLSFLRSQYIRQCIRQCWAISVCGAKQRKSNRLSIQAGRAFDHPGMFRHRGNAGCIDCQRPARCNRSLYHRKIQPDIARGFDRLCSAFRPDIGHIQKQIAFGPDRHRLRPFRGHGAVIR